MSKKTKSDSTHVLKTVSELAAKADYSFVNSLTVDPHVRKDGEDHQPRQVFTGHFVQVKPTPIQSPYYVTHSRSFFEELGFADGMAHSEAFMRLFSGDMSGLPPTMAEQGWATGYALSIYGTEYYQQCPFQTGNGYGDGRAISIFEGVLNNQRWEMQLKGAGRTPYCRGADGRAVLRSSVREFLVQEHMHALGIPTSRSLCLFMSQSETVDRPWYLEGSQSHEPEVMTPNLVAITTRVAPSFIRVGQLELFARRARVDEHPTARQELQDIVAHLITREYADDVNVSLPFESQVIQLASAFCERLTSLVANWVRVGYCQGNFNSDNCAAGGFTLDYGPFGFCELFEPTYQPWIGGGRHFSFLNQPAAAQKNFDMFCRSIGVLLENFAAEREELGRIQDSFSAVMDKKMEQMWADKLGLRSYHHDFVIQLLQLMVRTGVDYTKFFRALSHVPQHVSGLTESFYNQPTPELLEKWNEWHENWRSQISKDSSPTDVTVKMKQVNPKFIWREWLVVPAYQQAEKGDFTLIYELQKVLASPYDEQSEETEAKYYQLRPLHYFGAGGISHYSCSS
ncbi:protein adenylyltransferase SelO [Alteromonas sp. D210916BOD_24]|uniref:protein adenylyltransferase SelO n=1 Tax=Alteromonas sp. D210916BOD_24 TaxID=3157618 RepID=UPI00399CD6E5